MSSVASTERELRTVLGDAKVIAPSAAYLADQTEARGVRGRADAVALPETAENVATIVAWCYEHGVPVVPRGGGTGYAAGAVPLDGGVVVSLERLDRVRSFDPLVWRMEVEAGMTTAAVRRTAREGGLLFAPDPGAAEQSQIGGNVATNAGGPHAYKYGVTGAWVTGLEVVVAPGELVRLCGPLRKDVASYDLTARLVGSGLPVAAIEYLDGGTMRYAGAGFPTEMPDGAFCVITEADGSPEEAARVREDVLELLGEDALVLHAPEAAAEIAALWHWRDGVALRVDAQRGGKASEDIAVPLDRLGEAIEESLEIGAKLGLPAASWGHAGDGNLHTTFLVAADDPEEIRAATRASEELFALALRLGGTISGEHGVGVIKRPWLERQLGPRAYELHTAIKRAFDPQNLLNPGKK